MMNSDIKKIIYKMTVSHDASANELTSIIESSESDEYLFKCADMIRQSTYGKNVYIRGLIEISNICKNDCLYCGIRRGNSFLERSRLDENEIYVCCDEGYALGFRTFVLQGGEDPHYTDETLCRIVSTIKKNHPDCAVTLSLGERSAESYERLYKSGADRYLLRHETASKSHYEKLHPPEMSFENRMECLKILKKLGFQTGAGFMVGSPFQTHENLVNDLLFLKKFKPEMVGIGPFIPHKDTPFRDFHAGSLRDTLVMVALTRLLLPNALIPATTALNTVHPHGRELGLKAGANVIMPNLSPERQRKLYTLYDNKRHTNSESAQEIKRIREQVEATGYRIVTDRGDWHE